MARFGSNKIPISVTGTVEHCDRKSEDAHKRQLKGGTLLSRRRWRLPSPDDPGKPPWGLCLFVCIHVQLSSTCFCGFPQPGCSFTQAQLPHEHVKHHSYSIMITCARRCHERSCASNALESMPGTESPTQFAPDKTRAQISPGAGF